ncbi:heme uptake protein IsdC [Solibacillus sp. A46]|uniref:Heme uptake protein IsdC n=1 Tax=Solibacillus faecavium TaxID=2762221 RepID=A0ABR8XUL4_9BACL|nr:heme uptake protein IsdC [Solibacillus faecavium]MBD8035636.1 heme uptake protein IsdC [Solibacillus faecavium]
MKKNFFMILSVLFLVAFTLPNASLAAIADGTYEVNYQVNKPGSNSASMANDYFLKPAKLIVNNGKMTMQITIKNSSWVTEFKPPGGAKVISTNESAGQRTVQFPVSNANLVTIAMKIDIDDIDYHHAYSVDFVFNSSGLPEVKAEEPKEPVKPVKEETKQATSTKESPTPSSGSNTSSNKPAPSTEPQKTESSAEQANTEENTDDSTKTDEENASEAENSEVVENPETSDELPLVAMILFIVAAIVFIRTKQTKTR